MKQNINRKRTKFAAAAAALVLLFASLTFPCTAEKEQRVLRVGFPQSEGYSMTAPDGRRYGLIVDYLNEIAKYTGWQYEYVDLTSLDMLNRFFDGEFDLLGGTYYMDGYEEYFAYPDYNCGYSKLVLLARKGDTRIKSYDFHTFDGKTIGVFEKNIENIRRLKEYLKINGINCELKYYNYEQLSVTGNLNRFLENGEVDLLLGNSSDIGESFYIAAAFDSQAHYIVTQVGDQETLDGLNMALEKIYDTNPKFAEKVYNANFPNTSHIYTELNEQEKAYVQQKGTVTVAVPYNWHPMVCLNNDDLHNGLTPDFLNEISNFSGLKFSYLYCDSYADSIRKVQNGEADMLGFFVDTEDNAADQGLALTDPYVQLDSILVRNKESTYPSEGLVGAVLEGRKLPDDVVADEVKYYSDVNEALSDVNRGKVDFYYGLSSNIENIIQQENFTNIMQVNLVNNNIDVSFAMTRPVHSELFTILNKSLSNMTEEKKSTISNRNIISLGSSHITLSGIIYANPAVAISVVAAFLILILLVVILVSRSRLHAAVIQGELKKAEADSRAKSEFLSRMSHEIRTPMNAIVGLSEITGMIGGLPDKAQENLDKIKSSSHYLLSLISDILDMSRIETGKLEIAGEPFSMSKMLNEIESMMTAESQRKNLSFALEKDLTDDVLTGDTVRLRQVILNLLSNAFKFTPAGGTVRVRVTEDFADEKNAVFTFRVSDNGVGIPKDEQERIFLSFEQLGSNVAKSQGTGLGLTISKNIVQLMGGELKLRSRPGEGSEFYFTITLPKGKLHESSTEVQISADQNMLEGVSVLMAEDNDLNAEIAIELLKIQGADVIRAKNGKEAVRLFRSQPPNTYQVILMDVLMPEMNGLEATRAIRALPRPDAAAIPIVAMTANTFKEDVESAMASGMNGFVPKPIDVNYLYDALRTVLKNNE